MKINLIMKEYLTANFHQLRLLLKPTVMTEGQG